MNGEDFSFASQAPHIMSADTGPQTRNQLQLLGVSNGASETSLLGHSTGASMPSDSNQQAFPSMNHLSQAPVGSSFAAPGFQPMQSSDFFDPFPLDGNLDLDLLNGILFGTVGS